MMGQVKGGVLELMLEDIYILKYMYVCVIMYKQLHINVYVCIYEIYMVI